MAFKDQMSFDFKDHKKVRYGGYATLVSLIAVAALVLGEALLLCVAGAALGIVLAFGATTVIGPGIEEAIGVFEVRGVTVANALGLSAFLGLVVGAVPALTARRLSIVDALRER